MAAIKLSSYDPVSITLPSPEISEEDLDKAAAEYAHFICPVLVPSDHETVQDGDTVQIDLQISRDGVRIKDLCTVDRIYILGEEMLPPAFDEGILGMKVGEMRSFDFIAVNHEGITHAQFTYHADVRVKAIMDSYAPEVTEEWLKAHIPTCPDLKAYRIGIRMSLEEKLSAAIESERLSRSSAALAGRLEGPIGDDLLKPILAEVYSNTESAAAAAGKSLGDYMAKKGLTDQDLRDKAERILRESLAFDAWAAHHGIVAGDHDVLKYADMITGGKGKLSLERAAAEGDEQSLASMRQAATRYLAKTNVASTAIVSYE